ncbi:MAG: ferrous iron transporter B, partial [Raoultibacter sp.]
EGKYTRDKDLIITDLPGVYSLSPYSPEEIVTRDYLLDSRPDVVINLVDATNLERNLYLTTQILDLGLPVVVALNMMDLVEKNGDKIDVAELSNKLGCPVVETSALKGRGMDDLLAVAIKAAKAGTPAASDLRFDESVEAALAEIAQLIEGKVPAATLRWYAIKLFENEERTVARFNLAAQDQQALDAIRDHVEAEEDDDAESIITAERYNMIVDTVQQTVKLSRKGMNTTQKIDRVVTNRWLGLPIFIAIMTFVYYISVSTVGTIGTDWANDGLFGDGWLYTGGAEYEQAVGDYEAEVAAYLETAENEGGNTEAAMAAIAAEEPDPANYGLWIPGIPVVLGDWLTSIDTAGWLQSLILDGIVAGVGAVLGFVPQMIVLFLLLSILEACGYMARVAFIMDRIFRKFGLSGKSFIPMLIASGCGVPAVMATKTIENEKDRRMTIMTTTMIPCGAKLPIIALVFGALAGGDAATTWWIAPVFYFLGVFAIIISGIMLKKTKMFAGEATPFIMELPQYHIPAIKGVLLTTWERVRSFVVKAGTIIFLSSIVIWFLMNFGSYDGQFGLLDPEIENYIQYSLMAGLGNMLAWVFAPLGFGDWQATVTSITGLVAKENVVATVGILTNLGEVGEADPSMWTAFGAMLGFSAPAIIAFCAFNLLCAPCFAAIGTIRRQMESAKWTWFAIGYMTVFAWVIALIVYQLGGLMAGEIAFSPWTVVAIVFLLAMLFQLFRPMPKYEDKTNVEKFAAEGSVA